VSKVTKKYQATIPQDVRTVLQMRTNGIQKLPSLDWYYLDAVVETAGEWESAADEQAYSEL